MSKSIDLTLILPCFNEAPIIHQSVKNIVEVLSLAKIRYEIIFVDDKSRDATSILIKQILARHPSWRAVFHKTNQGRGAAVESGIKKARGFAVGFIDIDLEVSPIYIPVMADLIISKKADYVVGHRIYRTSITSIIREILSVGYRFISDKMLHTGKIDTESGYKFFNRRKIIPVLRYVKHKHWFWDTEITVYAKMAGLRIIELPVLFVRRFDKVSTVNLIKDTRDYISNLWELWRRLL